MASIKVRNLDDAVLLRLQSMAQATGSKSLEPYLRKLLTNHSKEGMRRILRRDYCSKNLRSGNTTTRYRPVQVLH